MAISIIEIDGTSHPLGASAANVAFDGTGAGIEAGTVQDAIEEVSVLAAEGSGVGVVDNLETADGQKALSAGMGKKLDEKASVVFNHMHWAAGSSSPSVNVGSHERYFCPENHTIYHFYGRIYASEPTTTTLTYQPSKEVVYYDLETATAWRWNGENMVLATYPPYYAIATSSNEGTIDGYSPQYVSDIYPRLVWFSVLRKLAWFYLDGSVRRYIAFDPDPNRVYVRLGTSPKLQRWDGTQWVDVGQAIDTSTLQPRLNAGTGIAINSNNQISVETGSVEANEEKPVSGKDVKTALDSKQDVLQYDIEPTENSVKMVNSGAVYEALMTLLGNITIDSNGNWKIGNVPTNYSAKGVQGETVLVTGDPVTIVGMLVNDLYTASAEKGTSAGVAVVIRNNVDILQAKVDALIDALAPLAYTGGGVAKAGLLDWSGNGVFFVTVGYNLTGVTATDNTDADSHIVVGGNLVVTLTTLQYYTLTGATFEVKDDKNNSVSYTLNGNTLTINNLTRSVTIKVVGVLSGAHLVTIPAVEHLTFKDENDNEVSGELIVPDGDPLELTLVPDELWGIESCAVEMGGDEVTDAYSWEFDENWNRVHTISIEEVTGDVDIVPVMENWNTFYSNVNALSGGRTLWNYYPSFMSPLFPLSTENNLLRITFDEVRGNGYPHTMSFYNSRFCSSIRNTIYNEVSPRSGSDVKVIGNYGRISFNTKTKYNLLKCEDITENSTLFDGSTFNDPVFATGANYISRFLPKIITPNGFKQTAIQDTAESNTNDYGTSIWAYKSKAWSEDTSACSFVFSLPKVANLTVYCGSNGGKLYTYDGSVVYTRSQNQVSGVQQLTSVETSHTKAILLCNGSSSGTTAEKIAAAASALNNAYVKYGDKYVWWGKGVAVAAEDIWEGAKVYGLPDFVEDVWTQSNS